MVLRMNMESKQKYGVAVLLSLGYIVTIAGAVRTYYIYKTFWVVKDQTWDGQYPAFLAAAFENNIALVN